MYLTMLIYSNILFVLVGGKDNYNLIITFFIYISCAKIKLLKIWAMFSLIDPSFLPLGATVHGELWPSEQSASILLYTNAHCMVSEQFSFYGVRLASRPTHNL
jgi:hypothetical protein